VGTEHEPVIIWVVTALSVFCGVCTIRVIKGPTLLDRIAAADAIGVMMTTILVLLTLIFQRPIFLDIAMVYSLLLFSDLMIVSRYLERGGGGES
jgi:multicomponent Na+:H+ antiporter subunit F